MLMILNGFKSFVFYSNFTFELQIFYLESLCTILCESYIFISYFWYLFESLRIMISLIDLFTFSYLNRTLNLSYQPLLKLKSSLASPLSNSNLLAYYTIYFLLQWGFKFINFESSNSRTGNLAFLPPSEFYRSFVSNHRVMFLGWIFN